MESDRINQVLREIRHTAYKLARREFVPFLKNEDVRLLTSELTDLVRDAYDHRAAAVSLVEGLLTANDQPNLLDRHDTLTRLGARAKGERNDLARKLGSVIRENFPHLSIYWVGPLPHDEGLSGLEADDVDLTTDTQSIVLGGISMLVSRGRVEPWSANAAGFSINDTTVLTKLQQQLDPVDFSDSLRDFSRYLRGFAITGVDDLVDYYDLPTLQAQHARLSSFEHGF